MTKRRKRLLPRRPLQRLSALGRIRSALREIDAIVASVIASLVEKPKQRKRKR
jgi:hypothetical protein